MLTLTWLNQLKQVLLTQRHRELLVISGDESWRWQQVEKLKEAYSQPLILSSSPDINYWPTHNHQLLGQEHDCVIFDCTSGLMPDKLASIAGTVKAGGVLALLVPSHYADMPDPAFERFQTSNQTPATSSNFQLWIAQQLIACNLLLVKQNEHLPDLPTINAESVSNLSEQTNLINELNQFTQKKRKACFLLTADRGRGKSAALGMIAAQWVNQGKNVIVCAYQKAALASTYKHYEQLVNDQTQALRFIAPDGLAELSDQCDLLLIDEAATIPLPTLKTALERVNKIGFATTLHGYEGTGRGFNLRFIPYLKQTRSNLRIAELKSPIRYSVNDPLEKKINQLLALDADFYDVTLNNEQRPIIKELSQAQLAQNPILLKQLFAVLVMAHYQTSANDLRHLLDGNNLRIFVSMQNEKILAAALVAIEGNIQGELAEYILNGTRRPQGNLLAQSIAMLTGELTSLASSYARIVRIAVNPHCQNNTIGTQLLQAVENELANVVDYIGASFGAESKLISFWANQQYSLVKLGQKQDKSSGEHSCLVLKGLRKQLCLESLKEEFKQFFFFEISRSFSGLPTDLVNAILVTLNHCQDKVCEQSTTQDNQAISTSNLYAVRYKLSQQIYNAPNTLDKLEKISSKLIIRLILQGKVELSVINELKLTGKKQLNVALSAAIQEWCENYPSY